MTTHVEAQRQPEPNGPRFSARIPFAPSIQNAAPKQAPERPTVHGPITAVALFEAPKAAPRPPRQANSPAERLSLIVGLINTQPRCLEIALLQPRNTTEGKCFKSQNFAAVPRWAFSGGRGPLYF